VKMNGRVDKDDCNLGLSSHPLSFIKVLTQRRTQLSLTTWLLNISCNSLKRGDDVRKGISPGAPSWREELVSVINRWRCTRAGSKSKNCLPYWNCPFEVTRVHRASFPIDFISIDAHNRQRRRCGQRKNVVFIREEYNRRSANLSGQGGMLIRAHVDVPVLRLVVNIKRELECIIKVNFNHPYNVLSFFLKMKSTDSWKPLGSRVKPFRQKPQSVPLYTRVSF
jgi:hypothetical protein